MHLVCVPAEREADSVRQFGANTADLREIVAWLKKCRVRTVTLEPTGIYWTPLFELLERILSPRRIAVGSNRASARRSDRRAQIACSMFRCRRTDAQKRWFQAGQSGNCGESQGNDHFSRLTDVDNPEKSFAP
jgi:hypothetical protein